MSPASLFDVEDVCECKGSTSDVKFYDDVNGESGESIVEGDVSVGVVVNFLGGRGKGSLVHPLCNQICYSLRVRHDDDDDAFALFPSRLSSSSREHQRPPAASAVATNNHRVRPPSARPSHRVRPRRYNPYTLFIVPDRSSPLSHLRHGHRHVAGPRARRASSPARRRSVRSRHRRVPLTVVRVGEPSAAEFAGRRPRWSARARAARGQG